VLVGGATDRPARQQTLRATIDWSYDLLDVADRHLFERLAVFAGGWTIDAAAAICNPDGELGTDTLDGLEALADMSLVHPVAASDGEPRFAMLQVIREFADEMLDAGPDAYELRRRHAMHLLELAEASEAELRSATLRSWQQRLRREQENLRAALRWAIEHDEGEIGLRSAGAVWDYWHYWAELREGARWLESLLALPSAAPPTPARAKGLRALAGLRYWQGDATRSLALYDEALAIVRGLDDERLIAAVLQESAWAAIALDDVAVARSRAEESRDRYLRAGDPAFAALAEDWLLVAPVIMGKGGDAEAAVEATRDAIEVNRALGRTHEVADWLEARAMIYRAIGDVTRADEAARDTLRLWHELGTQGRLPLGLKILAAVELLKGRPERAVRIGAAAVRYNDEIGGELPDAIAQLGDPVEEARPLLGAAEHARAVADGRSMTIEEQIAYALE
jgi:tetratricopeptide (TPR) repeat protein